MMYSHDLFWHMRSMLRLLARKSVTSILRPKLNAYRTGPSLPLDEDPTAQHHDCVCDTEGCEHACHCTMQGVFSAGSGWPEAFLCDPVSTIPR